jgi:hypothetical protein
MPFTTDDMSVFFDDDFAIGATYQTSTFRVVFDQNFRIVVGGVESSAPAVRCKTTDVTALDLKHEEEIIIGDNRYKIKGIQDDGEGFTVLLLLNIEEL